MVTFTQDQKNLTVPSSLGNFASNGSGGSGVTPAEVQEMINSSLTEYDETVQGYISDVDVDVEQNKEDIQDLSGTTSALTEGLNSLSGTVSSLEEGVATISGQTAQITAITGQIEAISGATEQNAQDIATLSATTSGISSDVDSLGTKVESLSGITSGISNDLSSLGTDVESLSGATSGIATDLQALSAYTGSIVIPDMANYTTTAVTAELSAATSGIAVDIETLSAYTAGIQDNDVIYEYNALNSKTQEERKAIWLECEEYIQNNRKVWIHYHTVADERWYLVYDYFTNRIRFIAYGLDKKHYINFSKINGNLSLEDYDILPVASSSTLGGVKVGSGLTIDGNGVLSVSGGTGGDSNYVIVDALSAITDPVEGMYVYVNSGITNLGPYSAFSFDASDCTGGNFYFYDSNNDQHYFYITGDNPPMVDMGNWAIPEGDGVWRMYTGWRGKLYIKYDSQTDIYSIAIPYEGAYDLNISLNDSVPYTASTETIPFENKGYFARRIQGHWIRTEYHFEEMSEADAVQAHSDIVSLSGQGYTEIYWKNQDGNISKAGWWNIDWSDGQKIRMIGTPQGDKWYTAAIYNSGSVEEKGDIQVKTQVYKAQFSFTPSTSAWTSNISDIAYPIYQSWDGEKIAYANVYFNEVDKKASMGNIMHFWRNSNDDMYYNFCFGFNFVDLDGVEWKTKWTFNNQTEPNYTLVSMTQVQ